MNYLLQGMESPDKIRCLLSFTKINSENKIDGLMLHFVHGNGASSAAALSGVPQQKLAEAIKALNIVAGYCERFYEIKQRELNTSKVV